MQRTVSLKLIGPDLGRLDEPSARFASACDFLASEVAAGKCEARFLALNAAYYHVVRERFGLMAQVAQSAERHVAGAFATLKANGHADRQPRFRRPFLKLLAGREWRVKGEREVQISVPGGRVVTRFDAAERDLQRLRDGAPGGGTLVKRGRDYYLKVMVTLPDLPIYEPVTAIGVDAGITVLAVARAEGARPLFVPGGRVRHYRQQSWRTRRRLQARGTPSAKRRLRALSGREQRFVLDQARVAAKRIVEYAQAFERPVIVLEDLKGLRARDVPGSATRRRVLHSWAYKKTLECITLKAEEAGVAVAIVNPAGTSTTCPRCGHHEPANRRERAFNCRNCAYQNHADVVGATNIQRRWTREQARTPGGPVNGPHGGNDDRPRAALAGQEFTSKPPTSVEGS